SSAERTPPPGVSDPSRTRTDHPSRASATAAASPLGPAPTTTASRAAMASPSAGLSRSVVGGQGVGEPVEHFFQLPRVGRLGQVAVAARLQGVAPVLLLPKAAQRQH